MNYFLRTIWARGDWLENTYDASNLLIAKTYSDTTPTTPLTYTYDVINRVTKRNTDTFTYNSRSEVTAATINSETHTYNYDNIGNFISTFYTLHSTLKEYTPNILNQYTSINAAPLTYDSDGNLLSGSAGVLAGGTLDFTYDTENRLTTVSSNGTLLVTNAYDHLNRRVQKITPSYTSTLLYDNWNPVLETIQYSNNTTDELEYVWAKNTLLAQRINNAWFFPLYDHNNNITDYVSASGVVVAHYEYDVFGNTTIKTGSMADVFCYRFSTHYFDNETGLYYCRNRFYSPVLGRWMNRDPIEEEGGLNLYAFCVNDSVNKFDLLGLFSLNLGWRKLTDKEMENMKNHANKIVEMSDEYILNIDNFFKNHFPQARPIAGISQPRELDRNVSLNYLNGNLVNAFYLNDHKQQGTLAWALGQIRGRLVKQKEIKNYTSYRMSTCRQPLCMGGLAVAWKQPGFIGFCTELWEKKEGYEQRGILAHEASHMFHNTLDFYMLNFVFNELPFEKRLHYSFAWQEIYESE